ncbi:MAG TPA: cell division protein FtsQ/DivIB [Gammaproteobacteria bacterium]|nr:cell division protein FtsQ/DivIB [Gammaproteobacteria bacterium]
MFGPKANRRRVESRVARVRLPTVGARWLRRLRAALLVPVMAACLYGFYKGVELLLDQPVRKLVVEGTFQRVTPIQVEAAIADALGGGFLTANLSALRERVEALDWVDRANVGRSWPDTLIVRVAEHQAAARWGDSGLLNVRGELFTERSQHALPELPSLAGPPGSERDVARRYLAVRGKLAEADLSLESLALDERGAWHLVLGGGQVIRLGRRDIDERLYRFFAVVAPALAAVLPRVDYVDLRYTNGFAVGWRGSPPANLAAVSEVPRG